jgi:hypothetical protein
MGVYISPTSTPEEVEKLRRPMQEMAKDLKLPVEGTIGRPSPSPEAKKQAREIFDKLLVDAFSSRGNEFRTVARNIDHHILHV